MKRIVVLLATAGMTALAAGAACGEGPCGPAPGITCDEMLDAGGAGTCWRCTDEGEWQPFSYDVFPVPDGGPAR